MQNAADAAALAGARRYAQSNDANLRARYGMQRADTLDDHPNADAEAERYAEEDAEKNNLKNNIEKYKSKKLSSDII